MSAQARYGGVAAQALQPAVGGELVLLDRVPLVDDEHDPLAGVEDVPDDVRVLGGVALGRIGHDDRHVGAVDRLQAAEHRVALDAAVDRPAAADAGGVDERHRLAVERDLGVDRVARRAGHLRHDHPLLPEDTVDERRLAGVRPADDRDLRRPHLRLGELGEVLVAHRLRRRDRWRGGRQPIDDLVGQVAGVAAVLRADRQRRVEAQGVELAALVLPARVVGLVDDEEHRLRGAPQAIGDVMVERRDAGRGVDDEEDDVGLLDGDAGLVLDPLLDLRAGLELEAAGVDHREVAAAPVGGAVDAVAGRAGQILDDRDPLTDETVEQRGLADVRAADDGDDGEGGHGAGSVAAICCSPTRRRRCAPGRTQLATCACVRPRCAPGRTPCAHSGRQKLQLGGCVRRVARLPPSSR